MLSKFFVFTGVVGDLGEDSAAFQGLASSLLDCDGIFAKTPGFLELLKEFKEV
jgi:hypothetical protein